MMRIKLTVAILFIVASASSEGFAEPPYSDGLHWFRDSSERKAAYIEVYRAAAESARKLSQGLPAQSWGVILDIDETILDNSEYQRRLALTGKKYETSTWDAWVQESAAPILPGAKTFIDTVIDELHGQVILVTDRTQKQCPVTEQNLKKSFVRYQQILCDETGKRDKNSRFRAVLDGDAVAGIAKVNVLIWVGDNIRDFPHLDQGSPGDEAEFGVHYFVLPDPMYGSWVDVPKH
jgi:5'-nucleotidase (lipoprotein e(P4) family)